MNEQVQKTCLYPVDLWRLIFNYFSSGSIRGASNIFKSILGKINLALNLGIGFGPSTRNEYESPGEQPQPLAGARNLADSSRKSTFLAPNWLAVLGNFFTPKRRQRVMKSTTSGGRGGQNVIFTNISSEINDFGAAIHPPTMVKREKGSDTS